MFQTHYSNFMDSLKALFQKKNILFKILFYVKVHAQRKIY